MKKRKRKKKNGELGCGKQEKGQNRKPNANALRLAILLGTAQGANGFMVGEGRKFSFGRRSLKLNNDDAKRTGDEDLKRKEQEGIEGEEPKWTWADLQSIAAGGFKPKNAGEGAAGHVRSKEADAELNEAGAVAIAESGLLAEVEGDRRTRCVHDSERIGGGSFTRELLGHLMQRWSRCDRKDARESLGHRGQ